MVLVTMHEHDLWPSRWHMKTQKVARMMSETGLCGEEHAFSVITRLGSRWTVASPLIDAHGNFGGPMGPPSEPQFTECRLSVLGALAAETDLGLRPPLPIGLITGTSHTAFRLGADPRDAPWGRSIEFQPGFDPLRTLATLQLLIERPDASDEDIGQSIGPPVILRAAPDATGDVVQLGSQTVLWHPSVEPDGDRRIRLSQIGPAFEVDEFEWEVDRLFADHRPGRRVEGPGGDWVGDVVLVHLAEVDDRDACIDQLASEPAFSTRLELSLQAPIPELLRAWVGDAGADRAALRSSIEDALDQLTGRRSPPSPTRR